MREYTFVATIISGLEDQVEAETLEEATALARDYIAEEFSRLPEGYEIDHLDVWMSGDEDEEDS